MGGSEWPDFTWASYHQIGSWGKAVISVASFTTCSHHADQTRLAAASSKQQGISTVNRDLTFAVSTAWKTQNWLARHFT